MFGLSVGGAELALGALSGAFSSDSAIDFLSPVTQKAISGFVKNPSAQRSMLALMDALGPGFEGFVREYAEKYIADSLLPGYDTRNKVQVFSDAWYGFALNSLTAAVENLSAKALQDILQKSPEEAARKLEEKARELYLSGELTETVKAEEPMTSGNQLIVEKFEDSDTISLPDVVIGRSVGAKAKNYDIMDLDTGEHFQIMEGSRIQNVEVFAGKGVNKPYRKAVKFVEKYGGKLEDWQHVKGFGMVDFYGEERMAELHWSQCEGVGKVDFFIKEWLD